MTLLIEMGFTCLPHLTLYLLLPAAGIEGQDNLWHNVQQLITTWVCIKKTLSKKNIPPTQLLGFCLLGKAGQRCD